MGHTLRRQKQSWPFRYIPPFFLLLGVLGTVCAALPQQRGTMHPIAEMNEAAINYIGSKDLADSITQLQKRIDAGKVKLTYNSKNGYLDAVLKELKIPISSQLLVFSKTSCQAPFTSPATPRALYFDDDTYVGFAQGDHLLDFMSIDPKKGVIFFTLEQKPGKVKFVREMDNCVGCHSGDETLFIPGLLLRSMRTDATGKPRSQVQDFVSGHNSPLVNRWGGWYVTGTHGEDAHLGNGFYGINPPTPESLKANSNITDLRDKFDTTKYPTAESDAVALLVLDHAVRMQNYIVLAQYESIIAQYERKHSKVKLVDNSKWRIRNSGDALLAYMLFRDEGKLKGPIAGTSNFAREFTANGAKDKKGRSLYEFDLKTRVFRYPCSYLIYSKSFDALPKEMKDYLWSRFADILTGKDTTKLYATVTPEEKKAVLEILLDTKPEFRAWWDGNKKA